MTYNTLKQAALAYPDAVLDPYCYIMGLEGFDAVMQFITLLGGTNTYIPGARRIFRGCITQAIRAEYNGRNAKQLARKYGCTPRHIKRVVRSAA